MSSAMLIVGHGSRDPEGIAEFLHLVDLCRLRQPDTIVEHGFLEFADPGNAGGGPMDGISRCIDRGATSITVLPAILLEAGHARNDIPALVEEARRRFPGIGFHHGRHLHLHPRIVDLCRLRIEQAQVLGIEKNAGPCATNKVILLVVGRGSSDRQANEDVDRLARILSQGLGLGGAETAFIDLAQPRLLDGLEVAYERCVRSGPSRVIVLPFLLFTGTLEKRARRLTAEFAAAHPQTQLLYAGHLNAHPWLVEALMERAREAIL